MTEMDKQLYNLILNKSSIDIILEKTGLSLGQLKVRLNSLKNNGYELKREYYSNGDIILGLKDLDDLESNNKNVTLITDPDQNEFSFMFVSDMYLCSEYERLDLINEAYEICAKKNINIILNGGIFIHMQNEKNEINILNEIDKNIKYVLKNYPYDKNIINFICHDPNEFIACKSISRDIGKYLQEARPDMISLGYNQGILNIQNDKILLKPISLGSRRNRGNRDNESDKNRERYKFTLLTAYSHEIYSTTGPGGLKIFLPPLSNITNSNPNQENYTRPGFIICKIKIKNGEFYKAKCEEYLYFNRFYKTNGLMHFFDSKENLENISDMSNEIDEPLEEAAEKVLKK